MGRTIQKIVLWHALFFTAGSIGVFYLSDYVPLRFPNTGLMIPGTIVMALICVLQINTVRPVIKIDGSLSILKLSLIATSFVFISEIVFQGFLQFYHDPDYSIGERLTLYMKNVFSISILAWIFGLLIAYLIKSKNKEILFGVVLLLLVLVLFFYLQYAGIVSPYK